MGDSGEVLSGRAFARTTERLVGDPGELMEGDINGELDLPRVVAALQPGVGGLPNLGFSSHDAPRVISTIKQKLTDHDCRDIAG